ncbi:MAG: hypothetical protein HYV07_27665 [Deltaproteobacteria bacterium]|nr:hypothetical protein [Deltaproteobacteria bacterium]
MSLAWGCSIPTRIEVVPVSLPSEITQVALLVDGETRSLSTGFLPLDSGVVDVALDVGTPSRVELIGYAGSSLLASYPPGPEELENGPVGRADADGPRLPTPDWQGASLVEDELVELRKSGERGSFVVPWLNDRCSGATVGEGQCPDRALAIEVGCELGSEGIGPVGCEAVARVDGCGVRLDLDGCQLPNVGAAFESESSLCFSDLAGCSLMAPDDALGGLACLGESGECRIRIHAVPREPRWKIANRLALVPGAIPTAPEYFPRIAALLSAEVVNGYLAGVSSSAAPKVAIVDYLGEYLVAGQGRPAARLSLIDRHTLELIETSTIPAGSSWSGVAGEHALVGFDRPARVAIKKRGEKLIGPVEVGPLEVTADGFSEVQGLIQDGADYLILVVSRSQARGPVASYLILVDGETLEPKARHEYLGSELTGLRRDSETTVWVSDNLTNRALSLEVSTGLVKGSFLYLPSPLSWTSWAAVRDDGSDRVLALTLGGRASIHVFEREQQSGRHVFFEHPGELTAIEPWPGEDSRMALGAARRSDRRSFFTTFDAERQKFELGALDIGFGPVSALFSDGAEGMVAVLPWAGEVVRVEPRD